MSGPGQSAITAVDIVYGDALGPSGYSRVLWDDASTALHLGDGESRASLWCKASKFEDSSPTSFISELKFIEQPSDEEAGWQIHPHQVAYAGRKLRLAYRVAQAREDCIITRLFASSKQPASNTLVVSNSESVLADGPGRLLGVSIPYSVAGTHSPSRHSHFQQTA